MRPFKVAHLMPFPGMGGTEVATLRIIRASGRYGVKHVAVFFQGNEALLDAFRKEQVPSISWECPSPSLVRRSIQFLGESRKLARELKRLEVDLVHCADVLGAYSGALAGRLAGVPVLCHVRNRHSDFPRRDQIFLRPVSHFAFVSKATWETFPVAVAPRRGSVLYDGFAAETDSMLAMFKAQSEQVRAGFSIPPGSILFGMFGRVAPQKDYDTLIRAASKVISQRKDVYFLICGDYGSSNSPGGFYDLIRQQLASAGVADHFRFVGFRTDVARLMGAIDVQVHSTHWEGLPLAVLEGMGCAKPVIATAVDGIPELVADRVTGWLYPHADADALASCLIDAAGNPDRCRTMGLEGRALVQNKFSNEMFDQNLMHLYEHVLRRPAGSGSGPNGSKSGSN